MPGLPLNCSALAERVLGPAALNNHAELVAMEQWLAQAWSGNELQPTALSIEQHFVSMPSQQQLIVCGFAHADAKTVASKIKAAPRWRYRLMALVNR